MVWVLIKVIIFYLFSNPLSILHTFFFFSQADFWGIYLFFFFTSSKIDVCSDFLVPKHHLPTISHLWLAIYVSVRNTDRLGNWWWNYSVKVGVYASFVPGIRSFVSFFSYLFFYVTFSLWSKSCACKRQGVNEDFCWWVIKKFHLCGWWSSFEYFYKVY